MAQGGVGGVMSTNDWSRRRQPASAFPCQAPDTIRGLTYGIKPTREWFSGPQTDQLIRCHHTFPLPRYQYWTAFAEDSSNGYQNTLYGVSNVIDMHKKWKYQNWGSIACRPLFSRPKPVWLFGWTRGSSRIGEHSLSHPTQSNMVAEFLKFCENMGQKMSQIITKWRKKYYLKCFEVRTKSSPSSVNVIDLAHECK
jgi:hypothetical protein